MAASALNAPVPGLPYFAPQHAISPGTPIKPNGGNVPTLFTPLTIRSKTLRNRIVVAPMCQYSAAHEGPQIGALTPYHVATLGHYALKGAALVFIEASGVQPNGRITPNCPGIWSDDQIPGIKAVVDICHAQGALCGIQLAHAGRKSSTCATWVSARHGKTSVRAGADVGGWPEDVVGPSGGEAFTWDGKGSADPEGGFYAPRELSSGEIETLVGDWAEAARMAIRAVIPEDMPLFLRLSATEWLEETELAKQYGSWDVESTIEITKILSPLGVDLLDVSSGGNHPQQRINMFKSKDYQTKIASRIRQELRAAGSQMLIGAVGLITEAQQARGIVETSIKDEAEAAKSMTEAKGSAEPMADAVLIARQLMREPEWVLRVAWQLGVDVAWPSQFDRVRFPRL
ncbi:NADH-dependent flavin oxidoreductase [Oleoguttula sp. CCFEE 5521]